MIPKVLFVNVKGGVKVINQIGGNEETRYVATEQPTTPEDVAFVEKAEFDRVVAENVQLRGKREAAK